MSSWYSDCSHPWQSEASIWAKVALAWYAYAITRWLLDHDKFNYSPWYPHLWLLAEVILNFLSQAHKLTYTQKEPGLNRPSSFVISPFLLLCVGRMERTA